MNNKDLEEFRRTNVCPPCRLGRHKCLGLTCECECPSYVESKTKKNVHFKSERQNWKTPKAFYQALDAEFGFDFDPCPPNPTFDGLKETWGHVNFCNPPYSEIEKWIKKGHLESCSGKTVVFLIPSRTDTKWWHDHVMQAKEIRFIKGRLKFDEHKNSAPFPSCIVVM